jgi:acetyltransferase-like isoleucine patch superfamily enzyme
VIRRITGALAIRGYSLGQRARSKCFSLLASGGFAAFGRRSVIALPVRLDGERRIAIGDGVFIGSDSWLQTIGEGSGVAVEVGDGTSIAGHCILSAALRVRLGRHVLLARNVYISDHIHAYADAKQPILDQGIDRIEPVEIDDGAWLGQNVVVCPGVRIGRGAVVGANSVVTGDIPDRCLAVGAPARVVKKFGSEVERAELQTSL